MSGIKFKGNYKGSLGGLKEGEIVFATDTEEWGLCVQEANSATETPEIIKWRKHERIDTIQNIFSGEGIPNITAQNGQWYFDTEGKNLYVRESGEWSGRGFPLKRSDWSRFLLLTEPNDYSNVLKTDEYKAIQSGVFPITNQTVISYLEAKNEFEILDDLATSKMQDNPVTNPHQVIFVGAEVHKQVKPDTETIGDGEIYFETSTGKIKITSPGTVS
jgi:hypothetical protein